MERGGTRGKLARVSLARVTKININSLCQCIRQSDSWPEKVPPKWLLSTLFLIISSEKGENAGKLIQIS